MSYSPSFFNANSNGNAKGTGSNFQNGSGSSMLKGLPVSVLALNSQLFPVDVSSEVSVQAIVGLTGAIIPSGATGYIMDNGRLQDVSTSFAFGDALYIAKNGSLTNVKPEIGTASFAEGDFVVFVGVVVKNEFNSSLKDIKLMISVIGQL